MIAIPEYGQTARFGHLDSIVSRLSTAAKLQVNRQIHKAVRVYRKISNQLFSRPKPRRRALTLPLLPDESTKKSDPPPKRWRCLLSRFSGSRSHTQTQGAAQITFV